MKRYIKRSNLGQKKKIKRSNLKHFADITSTKDLMHNGKLAWVVRRKVRGKDAFLSTTASQQFARSTR